MVPSIFGENMLDDFFDESLFGAHNPLYGKNARNLLKTDIREMDDSYELAVDLPGFKKDEINIDIKDGYLTVSAEKGLDKKEEDKKGRILRQERYAGVCSRSFYVGNVKPEDVKAKYESGVLSVVLPKVFKISLQFPHFHLCQYSPGLSLSGKVHLPCPEYDLPSDPDKTAPYRKASHPFQHTE